MRAARIHIDGVVQGVGFRPFVWSLADRLGVGGWVRNSSSGVDIHVEGPTDAVDGFVATLRDDAPPLAVIDHLAVADAEPGGHDTFAIVRSQPEPGAYLPVSPDVATCDDCLRELRDPADRRFLYPFLNCTNCGPRYTIVRDIPYDRPLTSMADFAMCEDCAREYADPADRRFHAQPVACPACGPRLWFEAGGAEIAVREDALQHARVRLQAGDVLAVKGLGGFHLVCSAVDDRAVTALRTRKRRQGKPFALMAPDLDTVRRYCAVDTDEAALLTSPARPVVLLRRRPDGPVLASDLAPGRDRLGFMLPYTPLHHLLLEPAAGFPPALVMTSANLSEEPIAYRNEEARRRLAPLADGFLLHDRPIHIRCDDPVMAVADSGPVVLRRSRGQAPLPVRLPFAAGQVLAVGGDLKNVVGLTRDDRVFLSHHVGDLAYHETFTAFTEAIDHLQRLFRIAPTAVACDLHPDYHGARWAREHARREGWTLVEVQHHHAHAAAVMAEAGLGPDERVIAAACDGMGYGPDGVIWGGEFLLAGYAAFERPLHLAACVQPGGDAATRHPCRMALAWLHRAGLPWTGDLAPVVATTDEDRAVIIRQLDGRLPSPRTTSLGRLFDAAAALAGLTQHASYEAQAACELEAAVDPAAPGAYPLVIDEATIDPAPALAALVDDVRSGVPTGTVAARFHRGVALMMVAACEQLRDRSGISTVALGGGVWHNQFLLQVAAAALRQKEFRVLVPRRVPAGDGGLALGQAAVAAVRLAEGTATEGVTTDVSRPAR